VDGHTDLFTPENSQTAGAAGMDLALVTGDGPELLTNLDAKRPYIRAADTFVFGYRWPAANENVSATPANPMGALPLERIREQGLTNAARFAVNHLEKPPTDGFWLHVDVDVLSPEWMPAVDSPDPGGTSPGEFVATLQTALASERLIGMELAIYDPSLDPGQRGAELIVDMLALAFAGPTRTEIP